MFHVFAALVEFERSLAGLTAARARGRKPNLSKADVKKAAAMLMDPPITKAEVARHFKVSRMTLNEALKREGYGHNPAAGVMTR